MLLLGESPGTDLLPMPVTEAALPYDPPVPEVLSIRVGLAPSVMFKPEHTTHLLYGLPGLANLGHGHFLLGGRGAGKNSVIWIFSAFANFSSIITVGLM
jgi:hypothetical protein